MSGKIPGPCGRRELRGTCPSSSSPFSDLRFTELEGRSNPDRLSQGSRAPDPRAPPVAGVGCAPWHPPSPALKPLEPASRSLAVPTLPAVICTPIGCT